MIWLSGKRAVRVLSHKMNRWLVVRFFYFGAHITHFTGSYHSHLHFRCEQRTVYLLQKKDAFEFGRFVVGRNLPWSHSLSGEILNQVNRISGGCLNNMRSYSHSHAISKSGSETRDKLTWWIILSVLLFYRSIRVWFLILFFFCPW